MDQANMDQDEVKVDPSEEMDRADQDPDDLPVRKKQDEQELIAKGNFHYPTDGKHKDHFLYEEAVAATGAHQKNMQRLAETRDRKLHLIAKEIDKENKRHESMEKTIDNGGESDLAEEKEHQRHTKKLHSLREATDKANEAYEKGLAQEANRHGRSMHTINKGLDQ